MKTIGLLVLVDMTPLLSSLSFVDPSDGAFVVLLVLGVSVA
jgi:hypothetical protein